MSIPSITCNIQNGTEVGLLQGGVNKSVITLLNEPLEKPVENSPGNTAHSSSGLLAGLTLGHPLGADLDAGLAESLDHVEGINTAEGGGLAGVGVGAHLLALGLVIATLGLELDTSEGGNS